MTAEVMQWVWFGAAVMGWALAWRLDGLLTDAVNGWHKCSAGWHKCAAGWLAAEKALAETKKGEK